MNPELRTAIVDVGWDIAVKLRLCSLLLAVLPGWWLAIPIGVLAQESSAVAQAQHESQILGLRGDVNALEVHMDRVEAKQTEILVEIGKLQTQVQDHSDVHDSEGLTISEIGMLLALLGLGGGQVYTARKVAHNGRS